MTIHLLRHSIG